MRQPLLECFRKCSKILFMNGLSLLIHVKLLTLQACVCTACMVKGPVICTAIQVNESYVNVIWKTLR